MNPHTIVAEAFGHAHQPATPKFRVESHIEDGVRRWFVRDPHGSWLPPFATAAMAFDYVALRVNQQAELTRRRLARLYDVEPRWVYQGGAR